MDSPSTATLQASAAFDRWRWHTAAGAAWEREARLAAADVQVWLAAGVTPEWTAGERAAFEAWCRTGGNARSRGVDGVPLRPDAQVRAPGAPGTAREAGEGLAEVRR